MKVRVLVVLLVYGVFGAVAPVLVLACKSLLAFGFKAVFSVALLMKKLWDSTAFMCSLGTFGRKQGSSAKEVIISAETEIIHWFLQLFKLLKHVRRNAVECVTMAEVKLFRYLMDLAFSGREDVKLEFVQANGVPCYWASPQSVVAGKKANGASGVISSDRVILYFHGGGFVAGGIRSHANLVTHLSHYSSSKLLFVDYRLAPENKMPDALEDAKQAYLYLLKEKGINPKNIVFAGDSAGATMVLMLLITLRNEGIELPSAGVCISPWIDLTLTGNHLSMDTKQHLDFITLTDLKDLQCLIVDDIKHLEMFSPSMHPCHNLPPLLLDVGEHEILESSIEWFAQKMTEDNVAVVHKKWSGMPHVFHSWVGVIPEAEEALVRIAEFIKCHTAAFPEECAR